MYLDKHNKDEHNFSFASAHTSVTSLLAPDTKQASFDRLEYGNR